MNLQQLRSFPKDRVRALLGLEPAALSLLLAAVLPELTARRLAAQRAKPGRKRSPGGGRRRQAAQARSVSRSVAHAGLPASQRRTRRGSPCVTTSHTPWSGRCSASAQTSVKTASMTWCCFCATCVRRTASMHKRSGPKKSRRGRRTRSTYF